MKRRFKMLLLRGSTLLAALTIGFKVPFSISILAVLGFVAAESIL